MIHDFIILYYDCFPTCKRRNFFVIFPFQILEELSSAFSKHTKILSKCMIQIKFTKLRKGNQRTDTKIPELIMKTLVSEFQLYPLFDLLVFH